MSSLSLTANLPSVGEDAARCIQRGWRRSRAGLDLLRKDKRVISEMTHTQFKKFCAQVNPLFQRGQKKLHRRKLVDAAFSETITSRVTRQLKAFVPVCTTMQPGKDMTPYRFVTKRERSQYPHLEKGCINLTKEAEGQYKDMPKTPPRTKEDLDALVKALGAQSDLMLWDGAEGCYARCQTAIDLLILSGVPKENIRKQYVMLPRHVRNPKAPMCKWSFHTAPLVRLEDGTCWILDPAIAPDKALRLFEWVIPQKNPVKVKTPVKTYEMGHNEKPSKGRIHLPCDRQAGCFLFTTARDLEMNLHPELDAFSVIPVTDSSYYEGLKAMAGQRVVEECSWLKIPRVSRD